LGWCAVNKKRGRRHGFAPSAGPDYNSLAMPLDPARELGKVLVVFGVALVAVGALLALGVRLPGRLGRLPGDIIIRRENFTFYFPLVTCLLLSVVLSLLFWFVGRR